MLDTLSADTFRPYLHQPFRVQITTTGGSQVRSLELIEVSESRYMPPSSTARRPFSLIFRDAEGSVLPQAIYQLEHAALGALDLFLVPVASGQNGTQYQAIFN